MIHKTFIKLEDLNLSNLIAYPKRETVFLNKLLFLFSLSSSINDDVILESVSLFIDLD